MKALFFAESVDRLADVAERQIEINEAMLDLLTKLFELADN